MENKQNDKPNQEETGKPSDQPKTEQKKSKEEINPNNITVQEEKQKTTTIQNKEEQEQENKQEETIQKTPEVKTPIGFSLQPKENRTENPNNQKGGL